MRLETDRIYEAQKTLLRLIPRLEITLKQEISNDSPGWQQFIIRVNKYFPALFNAYLDVYQNRYDFFYYLEDLLIGIARAWFARPAALRIVDESREKNPD